MPLGYRTEAVCGAGLKSDTNKGLFSIRAVVVKRFQANNSNFCRSRARASLRDQPWLSQHGISRKRRNNLTRVLIAVERSTQESKANSSHPSSREGHRCAGLFRSDSLAFVAQIVGAISLVQRNSVPSLHMRCIITASRRASATMAFFCPRRLAMFIAHAFSHDHFCTRVSMTCAAS